jgi:hypothetical protein
MNGTVVDIGGDAGIESAKRRLESMPGVRRVERDYRVELDSNASDPGYFLQWGLKKIEAEGAWARFAGGPSVVAVLDSGIFYEVSGNPEVKANRWINASEIPANGVDDDSNGFVDDVSGWNFMSDQQPGDVNDAHGHGTEMARIIGATAKDPARRPGHKEFYGIVGVNPKTKLMAVRVFDYLGRAYTSEIIRGVNYATAMGADVINASWGNYEYSEALRDAIRAAGDAGILFVASAGNDGLNSDEFPHYPSSYDAPNIISVAASDEADNLASFSNFGCLTTDVAAPGVKIYPGGYSYYWKWLPLPSGTSFAAAHVAGVASLLAAREPKLGVKALRARLLASVDKSSAFDHSMSSGGRLNAPNALDSKASDFTPGQNAGCVGSALPASVVPPTVTGKSIVGETLTATTGEWSQARGRAPERFAYQWWRIDEDGNGEHWSQNAKMVTGAVSANFRLPIGSERAVFWAKVTATATAGSVTVEPAQWSVPVVPAPAPVFSLVGSRTLGSVVKEKAIDVRAICAPAGCTAKFEIVLVAKRRGAGARRVTLASRKTAKAVSEAGERISVPLRAGELKRLKRELAARSSVSAEVSVTATSALGSVARPVTASFRVRR